jgi:hypothetical protein
VKKLVLFLLGASIGFALSFIAFYALGMTLEYFGVQLYQSEADQQRNFNIFLAVSIIFALISGFRFAKRFSK